MWFLATKMKSTRVYQKSEFQDYLLSSQNERSDHLIHPEPVHQIPVQVPMAADTMALTPETKPIKLVSSSVLTAPGDVLDFDLPVYSLACLFFMAAYNMKFIQPLECTYKLLNKICITCVQSSFNARL